MIPSELLSRAADLIRDTAAKASLGRWEARQQVEDDGGYELWWIEAEGHTDGGSFWGYVVAEFDNENRVADAAWIALMSPAVAPHLESWLRDTARRLDAWLETRWPIREDEAAAIRFALALLGMTVGEAERAVLGFPEDGEN